MRGPRGCRGWASERSNVIPLPNGSFRWLDGAGCLCYGAELGALRKRSHRYPTASPYRWRVAPARASLVDGAHTFHTEGSVAVKRPKFSEPQSEFGFSADTFSLAGAKLPSPAAAGPRILAELDPAERESARLASIKSTPYVDAWTREAGRGTKIAPSMGHSPLPDTCPKCGAIGSDCGCDGLATAEEREAMAAWERAENAKRQSEFGTFEQIQDEERRAFDTGARRSVVVGAVAIGMIQGDAKSQSAETSPGLRPGSVWKSWGKSDGTVKALVTMQR